MRRILWWMRRFRPTRPTAFAHPTCCSAHSQPPPCSTPGWDFKTASYRRAVSADGKYRQERAAAPELGGETFPISADASYGLARLAMRRGQLDDAARMLERLTAAYAAFGPAHRLLGQVYEKLGRREEAGERIACASMLLARTGDFAGARRHLEEALRIRPNYAEARRNLDRLLGDARFERSDGME